MERALNVYRVFNGFVGFAAVHRIVLAESEDAAVDKVLEQALRDGTTRWVAWTRRDRLSAELVDLHDGVETSDSEGD